MKALAHTDRMLLMKIAGTSEEQLDPTDCIRLAAVLVEAANRELDGSYDTCECCNLKVYNKWLHHNAKQRLKGFAKKLRNLAAEDPWNAEDTSKKESQ